MSRGSIGMVELPVAREDDPVKLIGMISKRDIISHYHERMSA